MDKQSDLFRQNAENCLELSEKAAGGPAARRYRRMAKAWRALAEEQDWLDGEVPPVAEAQHTA
jgi:hypothetical protein